MPINTKESYIELGTGYNENYELENVLKIPVPTEMPFTLEFFVDAGRNAEGTMIIQQIGRSQNTMKMKWAKMNNRTFWKMNRWFETFGYVFYIKFFNHSTGKVVIQRFYKGNPGNVSPSETQEIIDGISVPCFYKNVELSLIDMGESSVINVQQIEV